MPENMRRIYMDHNATTPLAPEVLEAMLPYLKDNFGNASSIHLFGQEAKKGVDLAREQLATFISAEPKEIVFTSGATEADNHAVFGVAAHLGERKGKHIITTAVEHEAVLHACKYLEKRGFSITYLPVDEYGMVSAQSVAEAIRPDTILISVMAANNEVGTINPVAEIGAIARENKVLFHVDAVQAAGKMPIDVKAWQVGLLSLSSHKIYGPKGVGLLYIRKGVGIDPIMFGGHHERRKRAGTENVAGIVGFGRAAELVYSRMEEDAKRIGALRDRLQAGIEEKIEHVRVNGHPEKRTFNTLNISFKFIEGEGSLLLLSMKGVAISTGSACTSGDLSPSHVLMAMKVPITISHSALRFSLGHDNTEADVDFVIEALQEIVPRLRSMSPIYDKFLKGEPVPEDGWNPDEAHDHEMPEEGWEE